MTDNKKANDSTGIEFKIEEINEELYKAHVPGHNTPGRTWREISIMYPDWTHGMFWRRVDTEDWFLFRMGPLGDLIEMRETVKNLTGHGLTDRQFLQSLQKILSESGPSGLRNFG